MSDLVITASQVLPDTSGSAVDGTAGVVVTAGQSVYLDAATNLYKLADADASLLTAATVGVALHGSLAGQPLRVQRGGNITLGAGAAPVVGRVYVQSATAGGIAPASDLATGMYTTIVGVGMTGNKLMLHLLPSGQLVP